MLKHNDDGSGESSNLEPPRREASGWESIFVGPQGVRAGWRMALFIAIFIFFLVILQVAESLLPFGLPSSGQITPRDLFQIEVTRAGAAVAATVVMSRLESCPFGDFGMPLRGAFGPRFWQGVLWGMAQVTVLMLLIAALGGYSLGGLALGGGALVRYALEWAGVFLLVGIFEESAFRGYLQFTMASATRFWPAATLTSLAFGAIHLQNPGEGLIGAASVFVIGMFLCLTLRRTGNLWFAIGWHTAFDFGETYIYAVPDSGFVAKGHLLAASVHGSRWVTGGSVGPEGSAAAFATVALAFVLFDRVYRARHDVQS